MEKNLRIHKILVLFLFFCLFSPFLTSAEKKSIKDLPLRYKKWLQEEVVYIVTPTEKNVFLQLGTDRERDLFIEAFWKHRDPTQGTQENEFKTEHSRRFQYANYTFGRSTVIPGWKTDRGRVYIILGEPRDIERFTGEAEIYNAEIWFYQGLTQYGLPTGFNLIFYQKGGVGEYVLYSPTADGPQALMTSFFGDQGNYMEAYKALKNISPTLAQTSMSLIPGESAQFGRPSLSSDILLQNVFRVPEKQFEDNYAEKFLLYKDIVEVDYSANYLNNNSLVKVFKDPSGLDFVHYLIELNKFSVTEYQDKYSTNLNVNGTVSNPEGKTIYQFESSLPLEFNKDQLQKITYSPFDLYDMFPLLPGDYKLSVLLKNEVSKEFTSIEENIHIPSKAEIPWMSPLVLGYKIERKDSENLKPFKLGSEQILTQPSKIFLPMDRLFVKLQVLGLSQELVEKGQLNFDIFAGDMKVSSSGKKIKVYPDKFDISEEFPLDKLHPGYYRINVSFVEENSTILSKSELFEITSASALPRPWVFSKTLYPASHPVYAFILGQQHFNKGEMAEARAYLEKAYRNQPDSLEYALSLARVDLILKNYEEARDLLVPFLKQSEKNYDILMSLGKAYQALGDYSKAISVMDETITHFGVNIYILNTLGECYLKLGNIEEALKAWNKSLEINSAQPEVKAMVESLRKKN